MAKNPATELVRFGTSVWYDNISREILGNGELKRLISEWGVRGLTSNPTIFEQAISKGNFYDATLKDLKGKGTTSDKIFEEIAVKDIADAADLLRPIYDESKGIDGYVSIEVSPLLAADTKGTIEEGLRLFKRLARPNIMIKVPGTPDGIPAVFALLEQGVNVNITLLFAEDNYVKVADTYCQAMRARIKKGQPIDKIHSVASFFVSRVDTILDKQLNEIISKSAGDPSKAEEAKSLLGQFGIANCKLVYKRYQDIFESDKFKDIRDKGGNVQRPLWASTGTKNPAYSDCMYVDNLIGPNTVNTMPHATLQAVVDHGKVGETLTKGVSEASTVEGRLKKIGVHVSTALAELQVDGVKKFSESFVSLNKTIETKLA